MKLTTLKWRMRTRARKLGIAVPRGLNIHSSTWGRAAQALAVKLQRHYKLVPSGEPTWALKWKLMPLNQRIVYLAKREVGTRETSNNWSARIKDYLAAARIGFPTAWCAAFVTFVVLKAGYKGSLPDKLAWVPSWAAWARAKGYTVSPINARRGDLLCVNWPGTSSTPDHIAIVTGNLGLLKRVLTIGGNEGDPGAVRENWRPYSFAHTVIRLPGD